MGNLEILRKIFKQQQEFSECQIPDLLLQEMKNSYANVFEIQ